MGTYTWIFPGMRLPMDTYLITVESVGSNNHGESYTVYPYFQAEPSFNIEKEFNDKARYTMDVPFNTDITGNLSSNKDHDYYKVELPCPGTLKTEFSFNIRGWYHV